MTMAACAGELVARSDIKTGNTAKRQELTPRKAKEVRRNIVGVIQILQVGINFD